MLMLLGLCSLTCPGLVKRRAADAHDARALLGQVAHVLWTRETNGR